MGQGPDVVAAGAVVWRKPPPRPGQAPPRDPVTGRKVPEVLLVHRPRYDDWSFPKGKLDPGEHVVAAAVREVAEETGLDVRLGPALTTQRYEVGNGTRRTKDVHYWTARVVGDDDIASYRPNDEIDQVAWLPLPQARDRLTYAYDRVTLDEMTQVERKCRPLIVLRHCLARSRKSWRGDDWLRTLTHAGELQAQQAVPVLAAYGVAHVVSSSSVRCERTVAPYAEVAGLEVELAADLSEEDASEATVVKHVTRLVEAKVPAVLCTHRPVLPWVFASLGLAPVKLEPGDLLVVHHRKGRVAHTEHHVVTYR